MLIFGVGIKDADYPVRPRNGDYCPFYRTWKSMIGRGYSTAYHSRQGYVDCTVCEEWHTFSNFKKWMQAQPWEGAELDKDLLGDGFTYSPENCCFLPAKVNQILSLPKKRDELPHGVYKKTLADGTIRYEAKISECRDRKFLGVYDTPDRAHEVWCLEKASAIRKRMHEFRNHPAMTPAVVCVLNAKCMHLERGRNVLVE